MLTVLSNLLLLAVIVLASVFYYISAQPVYRTDYEQQKMKTSQLVNENLHRSSLLRDAVLANVKIIYTELRGSLNRRRRDADDSSNATRDDSKGDTNNEKSEKSLFDKAGEALRKGIARAYQLFETLKTRVKKTIDSITGNN